MATLLRRGLDSRPEIGLYFTIGEGPRSGDTLLAASRAAAPVPSASTAPWPAGEARRAWMVSWSI